MSQIGVEGFAFHGYSYEQILRAVRRNRARDAAGLAKREAAIARGLP
jgi:hypothetical protein